MALAALCLHPCDSSFRAFWGIPTPAPFVDEGTDAFRMGFLKLGATGIGAGKFMVVEGRPINCRTLSRFWVSYP